jgi:crossover junction endodeoxyribonuclease RusA
MIDLVARGTSTSTGTVLTLELPWPPSINTYWRHGRGRTYLSAVGRNYRELVRDRMPVFHRSWDSEHLELFIDASPPDRRKRDLDNILKSLIDGLMHAGVYRDDSQIKTIVARMLEKHEGDGGLVTVTVQPQ